MSRLRDRLAAIAAAGVVAWGCWIGLSTTASWAGDVALGSGPDVEWVSRPEPAGRRWA
jgi:hypothetical protein